MCIYRLVSLHDGGFVQRQLQAMPGGITSTRVNLWGNTL